MMYENGLGVPEDYAEAELWFRRAADQGLKTAQWLLGTMYETGYGVPSKTRRAALVPLRSAARFPNCQLRTLDEGE